MEYVFIVEEIDRATNEFIPDREYDNVTFKNKKKAIDFYNNYSLADIYIRFIEHEESYICKSLYKIVNGDHIEISSETCGENADYWQEIILVNDMGKEINFWTEKNFNGNFYYVFDYHSDEDTKEYILSILEDEFDYYYENRKEIAKIIVKEYKFDFYENKYILRKNEIYKDF